MKGCVPTLKLCSGSLAMCCNGCLMAKDQLNSLLSPGNSIPSRVERGRNPLICKQNSRADYGLGLSVSINLVIN